MDDRIESDETPDAPVDLLPSATIDGLVAARAAVQDVEDLPMTERAAVFEQVHQVVVEELRQLELG